MGRVLVALALAGCGSLGSVQTAPDAPGLPDASSGVDSDLLCHSAITLKNNMAGHVGGGGGGKGPALGCTNSANERIVGVAVEMSDQNTAFGARSAQGIRIGCAPMTISPSGTATLGPISENEVEGTGQYGWSPSTWTAVTQCPSGSVVTGLLAHTGTNNNLFVDVSIICSKLGPNGDTSSPQTIKVVGSLINTAGPSQAQCGANQVVSELGIWDGAGLDAVDLFCSPSVCT
jgi:hypothetical protein